MKIKWPPEQTSARKGGNWVTNLVIGNMVITTSQKKPGIICLGSEVEQKNETLSPEIRQRVNPKDS